MNKSTVDLFNHNCRIHNEIVVFFEESIAHSKNYISSITLRRPNGQ